MEKLKWKIAMRASGAMVFALVVVYVLGIGPYYYWEMRYIIAPADGTHRAGIADASNEYHPVANLLTRIYSPLLPAAEGTPFEGPLGKYITLWTEWALSDYARSEECVKAVTPPKS
jgi:hypothetical protein